MKSYVLLGCIVVLAIVSSAKSNESYHKYLTAVPAEIQTKCLGEADLVADKDKLLSDESTVDSAKLNCYTACTLKESGVMTDGNISYDVLEKQLGKVYAGDPKIDTRKDITKACVGEATGANDCEKVGNMANCIMKKLSENGIN